MEMKEVAGSEFELKADLVLLAMGFTGPVVPGLVDQTQGDARSARQRCGQHERLQDRAPTASSHAATCGAASRWSCGPSARDASARASVDEYLMGASSLPR